MPLFFLGTREWRNRQTRTVQVRVPVMEWGFNSPLAHDETADPLRICGFCFAWLRLGCRRTCFLGGYRTLRVAEAPRVFRAPEAPAAREARQPHFVRRRASKPGQAPPPPTGTAAGPSGALRTSNSGGFAALEAGCRRVAGAGYGLFVSVRWVAGLVETWKGRGMPTWPSWRKR